MVENKSEYPTFGRNDFILLWHMKLMGEQTASIKKCIYSVTIINNSFLITLQI